MSLVGIQGLVPASNAPTSAPVSAPASAPAKGVAVQRASQEFGTSDSPGAAAFDEELLAVLAASSVSAPIQPNSMLPSLVDNSSDGTIGGEQASTMLSTDLQGSNAGTGLSPLAVAAESANANLLLDSRRLLPVNGEQGNTVAIVTDESSLSTSPPVEASPSGKAKTVVSFDSPDGSGTNESNTATKSAAAPPSATASGQHAPSDSMPHKTTSDTTNDAELNPQPRLANNTPNSAVVPVITSASVDAQQLTSQRIAAPVELAEQIAHETLKHAEVVKHHGTQRFTMRLDPPRLGQLVIEMERTEHGIALRMSAGDPATLSLIRASVNDLSRDLAQHESIFQEVNIDVTTDDHSSDSRRDETFQKARKPTQTETQPTIVDPTVSGRISFMA